MKITGIFYNVICLLFVLAAWYPACHCVQTMVTDENFAQTWYVFWILSLIHILCYLNLTSLSIFLRE